jgi:hypothetical protein
VKIERAFGGERSAAGAGLVSVPTTHAGVLLEAVRRGEAGDLRKAVHAFKIDTKARVVPNLRRAVGFAARAHAVSAKGHRSDVCWMVTLTIDGTNDDWRPEWLTTAMNRMRDWCSRSAGCAFRYVWVAELQKRGVIHYHVAVWLPRGVRCPKFDKRGWWPHGMTNTLKARHATAYLMSYLKKGSHDGDFPRGSRRYGVGGLDHVLRRARRWLGLPAFVQGNSSIHDRWERRKGGGWTSPQGAHFQSEFERVYVGDGWSLRRVAAHPIAIEAAGPFSWLSDKAKVVTQ